MSIKKNSGKSSVKKNPKGKGSGSPTSTKTKPSTSTSPAAAASSGGSSSVSKISQTPYNLTVGKAPFGTVASTDGSNYECTVLSISGVIEVSEFYNFTVTFLVDHLSMDPTQFLGQLATLSFNKTYSGKANIIGEINQFSVQAVLAGANGNNYAIYEINICSSTFLLLNNVNTEVYLNQTVPDIIQAVFKRAKVVSVNNCDSQYISYLASYTRNFTFQYEESDVNFVKRLLERAGMYFYFDFSNNKEQIVLANKSMASSANTNISTLTFGRYKSTASDTNLMGLYYNLKTLYSVVPSSIKIYTYDYNYDALNKPEAKTSTGTSSTSSTPTAYQSNAGTTIVKKSTVKTASGSLQEWVPDILGSAELAEYAEVVLFSTGWKSETYEATAYANIYLPGYNITLEDDSPTFEFESIFIFKATYDISVQKAAINRFALDYDSPPEKMLCTISGVPMSTPYLSPIETPQPKIAGFIPAFVDGTCDAGAVEVNQLGEYVIKLPVTSTKKGKGSTWIRKLESQANTNTSTFYPLGTGTEVLLSFQNGNPDVPIIMGAVPNITYPSTITSKNSTFTGYSSGTQPPKKHPAQSTLASSSTRSPKAVEELTTLQSSLTGMGLWSAKAFSITYNGAEDNQAATIAFPNGTIKHFTAKQVKEITTQDSYAIYLGDTYSVTLGDTSNVTHGDSVSYTYGKSTSYTYGNKEGVKMPAVDYSEVISTNITYGSSSNTNYGSSTNITHGDSTNTTQGDQYDITHGNIYSTTDGDSHNISRGNTISITYKSMESVTMGGSNSVMLGEGLMAFIGLNAMINVGLNTSVNIGPQLHKNIPEENHVGLNLQQMYEGSIVLQCGASVITMTPVSIEIASPSISLTGASVNIAAMTLTAEAATTLFL